MSADLSTEPRRAVDRVRSDADDGSVAEYALITAVVASLAISLATIPESQLSRQLPVTAARAQALLSKSARSSNVPPAQARSIVAHAPYGRAPLRYLYAEGWLGGRRNATMCVFAKASPGSTRRQMESGIRKDARLTARLRRMHVTVGQAAEALSRGTAAAC
jgi:hypothetical protein